MNNKLYKIIVLLLIVVITTFTGLTLARYISTFSGTGSATIAKWNIVLKNDDTVVSENFTFDLAETKINNSNVQNNVIAPGDSGSFVLNITDSGTQVSYRYKIELDTSGFTEATGNIKFYSDPDYTLEWENDEWIDIFLPQAGNNNISRTIYWKWVSGEENNANDTTAGITAATLNLIANITAEQCTTQCIQPIFEFEYTGEEQIVMLPAGTYKLEVWGANGGDAINAGRVGGIGGYVSVNYSTSVPIELYIYVGGKGSNALTIQGTGGGPGGYNGGGQGGNSSWSSGGQGNGGGGGGRTDIRTSALVSSTIIVAGGGGGAPGGPLATPTVGSNGGGLNGDGSQGAKNDIGGKGSSNSTATGTGAGAAGIGGTNAIVATTTGAIIGGTSLTSTQAVDTNYNQGGNGSGSIAGGGGGAGAGTGLTAGYPTGGGGGAGYAGGGGGRAHAATGAGGGGSGWFGSLAYGINTSPTDFDFVPNPNSSGNGFVRITRI